MTWRNYREYLDFKQVKRGPWVTFEARSHLRDSGRLPGGEDAPAAECEASQSGAESASPK
jgi:hypothetical protein